MNTNACTNGSPPIRKTHDRMLIRPNIKATAKIISVRLTTFGSNKKKSKMMKIGNATFFKK
jgi:hypothetical protein